MGQFFPVSPQIVPEKLISFIDGFKFGGANSQTGSRSLGHLAIIMDGNRRWAKERGLAPWVGHEKGVKPVTEIAKYCVNQGIEHLSLFLFSIENFNRSQQEKDKLFGMFPQALDRWRDDLVRQEICVKFVGERSMFPVQTQKIIDQIESETKDFDKLNLNLLFCYGGHQEIVAAAKTIARKVENNELKVDDINTTLFEQHLWMGDSPKPDLIIRTGKRKRLSNFLTYQSAYAELEFLDIHWPDVTPAIIDDCVASFEGRNRTFGR